MRKNDDWRMKYNIELDELTEVQYVVRFVKVQWRRLDVHKIPREEKVNQDLDGWINHAN